MLFELYLEFADGHTETKIVHTNPGEQVVIRPKQDKIIASGCKRFLYHVDKHAYLCKSIVRLLNKTMIFPAGIECHPKTTLDDIIEIIPENEIEQTPQPQKPEEKQQWKFESSSGGGTYVVKLSKNGKLTCDCPGVWRSKDRKCKHIKEVESY